MKRSEASEITTMLRSAFPTGAFPPETVLFWEEQLLPLHAQDATQAVLRGVKEWSRLPSLSEFMEFYRIERKLGERDDPAEHKPMPDRFAGGIPFYVKRWVVARFLADPPDSRPFRESYPEGGGQLPVGAEEWMPEGLYDEQAKTVTDAQVLAAINSVTKDSTREDNILQLLGETP